MAKQAINVVEPIESAALADHSLHALRLDGRPGVGLVHHRHSSGRDTGQFLVQMLVEGEADVLDGRRWLVHMMSGVRNHREVLASLPTAPGKEPTSVLLATLSGVKPRQDALSDLVQVGGRRVPRRQAEAFQARVPALMAAAGFPDPVREAFGLCCRVGIIDSAFLTAAARGSQGFRDFCAGHPFLAALRWPAAAEAIREGRCPIEAARLGDGDGLPRLSPAQARALRGRAPAEFGASGCAGALHEVAALLAIVPPDWIPTGMAQSRAFGDVAGALVVATQRAEREPFPLIAPAKGDWLGFRNRCVAAAGLPATGALTRPDLRNACMGLDDGPRHLARAVLKPVALRAGLPRMTEAHSRAKRKAFELAYGEKGLPAILEASREWHALEPRITAVMHGADTAKATVGAGDGWPHAFEEGEVDGFLMVPLRTALDLAEEGGRGPDRNGAMGLAHCVATYLPQARAGETHIVSVRRRTADGYERVATAELDQSRPGPARILQVRGRGNGLPGEETMQAVMAYAFRHRDAFEAAPGAERDAYDGRDDALVERVLRAYDPLLPRAMRGLDLDGLARALGFAEPPGEGPSP